MSSDSHSHSWSSNKPTNSEKSSKHPCLLDNGLGTESLVTVRVHAGGCPHNPLKTLDSTRNFLNHSLNLD